MASANNVSSSSSIIAAPGGGAVNTTATSTVEDSASTPSDYYHVSSCTSCPPLVQLQVYGLCCPFFISEEEHDARIGVMNLHNYPIVWYRKKLVKDVVAAHDFNNVLKTTANVVDGMITQLFFGGGGGTIDTGAPTEGFVGGTSIPMSYIGIPSTLTVVDTDTHGPVIQIRTLDGCWDHPTTQSKTTSAPVATTTVRDYLTNGKPWWNDESLVNKPPAKVIPLHMVDKVSSSGWNFSSDGGKGGVRLYAAPAPTSSSEGSNSLGGFRVFINGDGYGHELLRFDTLGGGGETMSDSLSTKPEEPNKYADKVIVQLKSLIDWNRRRMASDIQSGRVAVAPKGGGNVGNHVSGYIATKI